MRPQSILFALFTLSSLPSFAKLEAHEWGTFTSLVGSNGVTQNGMIHEDEVLPLFVHEFGQLRQEMPPPGMPRPPFEPPRERPCRGKACFFQPEFFDHNPVTQKMETPVIYFYADRAQSVSVNVKFPQGVVTQTFPGPVRTSPTTESVQKLSNGDTTFDVDILNQKTGPFPYVDPKNIYIHARAVESNALRSGAEHEKFIFYRGIGQFQPAIEIGSVGSHLELKVAPHRRPQAAFLVHVDESGHGQVLPLKKLADQGFETVSNAMNAAMRDHSPGSPAVKFYGAVRGEQARGMLIDALTESGLFRDEAIAMINTWEHGYLKVPGLRLLYVLPAEEVEDILPLTMTPAPERLVRSFVGRIEILLQSDEERILGRIASERDMFKPGSLGRFAEPIMRRVREVFMSQPLRDPALESLIHLLVQQTQSVDAVPGTVQ
ncbi:MAG: hypothetical protein KF681_09860 [Bdellovibrionaceae bacterium]|nr:hypothetical protein [Pseudobdellovibrionaceae bacterium]